MLKQVLASTFFLFAAIQNVQAQLSIEQLIEQTSIEASETAMRDLPSWSGVDKVLVRAGVFDSTAASNLFPGVEFVMVRSANDALTHADSADGYIGDCNARFIESAPDLKWVQRTAAGVESCVDIPRIASGEVVLTNMQKMESPLIAEHAISMMMSLARGIPAAIRDGSFNGRSEIRSNMTSVVGKKLLVVGLGGIGTEVARFGDALGMHVSATRNSSRNGPEFVDYVGLSDELFKLASEADVIISALPLTESTTNLFDAAFFDQLQPSAYFINMGRGKSVVTQDLYDALVSGKIAGAGMDVTEPEPLPASHPLWDLPNVVITPHVSSGGSNRERRAVLMQENIRRFINGDALLNVVDPARGY